MKKLIPSILLALCVCALFSCKKKGENQGLDNDNQKKFDFMSTKPGSWWRYGSRDGILWKRESRGIDTVIMDRTYSYYERRDDGSPGYDPEYFGKNKENYFTLIDVDGSRDNYIDYLFWKKDATAGSKWDNTGSVKGPPPLGKVAVLIESSLISNTESMTIGSNTFNDIIHVKSNLKAGAANTSVGSVNIWFKKDVGVIKEEVDINVLSLYNIQYTDSLIDYHLEP